MVSWDISYDYFGISICSLMQKYIVYWLSDVWGWVRHMGLELVTKYLNFCGNHSSYVYCRRVNKLWVLVTFHATISVLQHDHSGRTTLFSDSLMSEGEVSTLGWKFWWNVCIFLKITGCICKVEKLTSYRFWWHCMPIFWLSSRIFHT